MNIIELRRNQIIVLETVRLRIVDIHISSFHINPQTIIRYEYETADGKKGVEENEISTFKKYIDN